ncbi:MAG: nitroreductase family deazaflavin-dependent oxidoreductase [Acidimicrobiales bacterium]
MLSKEGDPMTETPTARYIRPDWFTRNVLNPLIGWLTRRGISVLGTRELRVAGRTSGKIRSTVVNVLEVGGGRYLVAPRGTTQWVRNVRAAGGAELRLGRRVERVAAREVPDPDKGPVIRAYVDRWGWEVGKFFDGLSKHPTDEELSAVASGFPVFAVDAVSTPLPSGQRFEAARIKFRARS